MGVVGRGNCESYLKALPMQNNFMSFSTLKQVIYYCMYVQHSQSHKNLKASPEMGQNRLELKLGRQTQKMQNIFKESKQ